MIGALLDATGQTFAKSAFLDFAHHVQRQEVRVVGRRIERRVRRVDGVFDVAPERRIPFLGEEIVRRGAVVEGGRVARVEWWDARRKRRRGEAVRVAAALRRRRKVGHSVRRVRRSRKIKVLRGGRAIRAHRGSAGRLRTRRIIRRFGRRKARSIGRNATSCGRRLDIASMTRAQQR